MARQTIQTATQQLAGDEIVETRHHNADPQPLGIGEATLKVAMKPAETDHMLPLRWEPTVINGNQTKRGLTQTTKSSHPS